MQKMLLGLKIKNYQVVKFIGKGQFAQVYKAIDQNDKKMVAMKVMLKSQIFRNLKRKQLALAQIKILKQSNNPNIIKYYDSFENNEFLFIITEYCNGGDLSNLLLQKNKIPQDQAIIYLKQIMHGFRGLREIDAMHRDFKAANVLLHDNVCKLADFGVSKQIDDNEVTKTLVGTVLTSPPEVLEYLVNWSSLYQMIYGDYPHKAKSDTELLEVIRKGGIKFHKVNINQKSKDFIQRCLTIDPKKRISWEQIFQHPLIGDKERIKKKKTITKEQQSLNSNSSFPNQQVNSGIKSKSQNKQDSYMQKEKNLAQQKLIHEKTNKMYENRINDILFVEKFIRPQIQKFQSRVRLNHSTLLFLFYKKAYVQLINLQRSLKSNQNIFNIQNFSKSFVKTRFYQEKQKQIEDNISKTKKYAQKKYKSLIKISSLQIQNEFDLTSNNIGNLDLVLRAIIKQYETFLQAQMTNQLDKDNKNHMMRLKNALIYYQSNKLPNSQQYQKIAQNTSAKQGEFLKKKSLSFV